MDRNNTMERRQTIMGLVAIFSLLLQACGGKEPTQNDIIGTWKSAGDAEFIFNRDGTFTGKLVPSEFGFMPSDSLQNVKFNGNGKWELRKGSSNWEIYVDFDKVSVNKNGCAFPLLISGESGILENEPPWYLFVWKGEEGGERYKFVKR